MSYHSDGGHFYFVTLSKQTALLASGRRTAELYFFSRKNERAGAQTNLSDGENLVEGDIPGKVTKAKKTGLLQSFLLW